MNILFAFGIILHTFLILSSLVIFYNLSKQSDNPQQEIKYYLSACAVSSLTSVGLVSLCLYHVPGFRGTALGLMGYTGIPIVPLIIAWVTYVLVQTLNQTRGSEIKYSSLFWGIVLGAPISFGIATFMTSQGLNL